MTLPSDALIWAAFFVALFVTLGAVPLCAQLLATLAHRPADDRTLETAGLGLFVGVAISSFYLGVWPAGAKGLALSALFVLIAGTAIDVLERHGRLVRIDLPVKIALSAVAICGVWIDLNHWPAWPLGMALLIAAGIMMLVSMSRIGHDYEDAHPGLTIYLTITQMLGLLLLGWIGSENGVMSALTFSIIIGIAVPIGGALLAAAFYMIRAPWRPRPMVFAGTGGHMMLAVGCVWMALLLALSSADGARSPAALVWVVGVPLFYFVRQRLALLVSGLIARRADGAPMPVLAWLDRELAFHMSPWLLPLTSLGMAVVGALVLYYDVRQLVSWPTWLVAMAGFILLPAALRHTPLARSGVIYEVKPKLQVDTSSSALP
ncbi:MAG: hypothetical protein R3E83_11090 [Burkholderiaceae bacterium]